MLIHHHEPDECGVSFAAWKGFDSPLRRSTVMATCLTGGHCLWWTVDAPDARAALSLLPTYVAERTEPLEVRPVDIP